MITLKKRALIECSNKTPNLSGMPQDYTDRNYRYDTIRCIGIFMVVFGHLLENISTDGCYKIIYSFHMPLMLFVSGRFAKLDRWKWFSHLIYPFILLQTLYKYFDYAVLNNCTGKFVLSYTTPYWLLWYLMALAFYYIFLELFKTSNHYTRRILFAGTLILSIAVGFDGTVGRYLTLMRFISFLPYFILGVFAHETAV